MLIFHYLLYFFSDLADILFVINYDYPDDKQPVNVYLNRIANISSSESTNGYAITFFSTKNMSQVQPLIEILREMDQVRILQISKETH
jgi:hypothetical protein